MTRVLIAYASKHGSTEEVARSIARTIRHAGHHVDVRDARLVTNLDRFDGVVLGGSLYMGRWNAHARDFLRKHRAALEALPLAVFALGPLSMDEPSGSQKELARALARAHVEPDAVEIFGGVIDPAKLRFPFNRMVATDQRDWDAIERWAKELATLFERERSTVGV
jgi:menaquinone-dependent protoporphyrinogen oxidase